MAETGDEHRIVDRRCDRIAPPGQKSGGNRALVAIQRGADPRVDTIAQILHEGGVTQGKAACGRRVAGLDAAGDKARGADALKEQVTAKVVAARPQWGERRLQPRFQFDEASDRRRRTLAHRQPHPLQLGRQTRAIHLRHLQYEAVGAFANVSRLDKARERYRIGRLCQHLMADMRGSEGRGRKAGRHACDHHG